MGYRCGFLLLAEEKNKITDAIEEVFRNRAEESKILLDKYYADEEEEWANSEKSESQRKAREENKKRVAIDESELDCGLKYVSYMNQGLYVPEGFDADKWFRKPGGILSMNKNKKYDVMFESSNSNTGFKNIYGGRSGAWKTRKGEWISYYDQPLFYEIIDKIKKIKNNNVKLFTFEVNDGIRRTKPKFAHDWTGKFM